MGGCRPAALCLRAANCRSGPVGCVVGNLDNDSKRSTTNFRAWRREVEGARPCVHEIGFAVDRHFDFDPLPRDEAGAVPVGNVPPLVVPYVDAHLGFVGRPLVAKAAGGLEPVLLDEISGQVRGRSVEQAVRI